MSSKVVFHIFNNTKLTLVTQTTGDEHIENNGDGLNGLTLDPVPAGNEDDYFSAAITVTTGDHNGSITLNFLNPANANQQIASLRCTNLKNPETEGVLIPVSNAGYELKPVGYRSVNNARLIEINIIES